MPLNALGLPSTRHSYQNSYAYGDRKRDEWAVFSLGCDSLQRIVASSSTDFECLITEIGRLVDGYALAPTEATQNFD